MAASDYFLAHARVSSKKHKGIKADDIFGLFQQLSTMLQAGMPLMDALDLAGSQTQSSKLAVVMDNIAKKVQSGSALWAAAKEHPKVFESHWIQVIRTGEISGQIGPLLGRLTQNMKETREAREAHQCDDLPGDHLLCRHWRGRDHAVVRRADFYAVLQRNRRLAAGDTRAVIGVSDFLSHFGVYLVIGVIGAAVSFRYWLKSPSGGRTFISFMMSVPVFGDVLVNAAMEKFATNLALLLRAGMPLLESLFALDGIFEKNRPYLDCLHDVQKRVSSGGNLATGMAEAKLFTPIMITLIRVGEESGQLPLVLEQVSAYYKAKVAALAARITAMIEPCIILGMGVTVAIILTSIYLPMFNMGGAVH